MTAAADAAAGAGAYVVWILAFVLAVMVAAAFIMLARSKKG
jgi:hypothetical protein